MSYQNKYNLLASKLKPFFPSSIRTFVRNKHQKHIFAKSITQFKNHVDDIEKHPELISNLIYGWGNMGWSALNDYLLKVIIEARDTNGPILECGSGLSTLLMGIIAERKNIDIYALEHTPLWAKRVNDNLRKQGVGRVKIIDCKITDYGDFEWYNPVKADLPKKFELVICDGPPGDTKGGRYGLMPVMADHFSEKTTILFDDYIRTGEQNVVDRWKKNYDLSVEISGKKDVYAKIKMGAKIAQH